VPHLPLSVLVIIACAAATSKITGALTRARRRNVAG
jgi:hypothetical protein